MTKRKNNAGYNGVRLTRLALQFADFVTYLCHASAGTPLSCWFRELYVHWHVHQVYSEEDFIYIYIYETVSSKIYDKRDDFDFDIVNFPFLDGDVPRRASYGVYISQLIRFARVCNHVTDFNARNKCLTAKLLQQGYRYHKLRKSFSKFYRRHYELISKYNVGLKTLLSEGLSEPEFYGDLVYKLKKLIGINDFSFQFRKIITRYRRIGYNLNVMRQSACLVFNPIMVDNYAAFFIFILVGWGRSFLSVAWPTGAQLVFFFCSGVSSLFGAQGSPSSGSLLNL